MVKLKSLNEYSLHAALSVDAQALYDVLAPAVIGTSGSANQRLRKSKKLWAHVRRSIFENNR